MARRLIADGASVALADALGIARRTLQRGRWESAPGSIAMTPRIGADFVHEIGGPAFAIDDQTAIKVADDAVEVVSEGRWKQFP